MKSIMIAAAVSLCACGGKARPVDAYRADTEQLLATRDAQIRSCYDAALTSNPTLAGTVKVHFVVAKKTGAITNPTLDPASTAPAPLGDCVMQALAGLTLSPADRNEGRATFEYAFQPATGVQPALPAAAGATGTSG